MGATFQRVLAGRLEHIAVLADELAAWAQQAGVPQRTVGQVNLMIDELVTNVILYGYKDTPGEPVRVDAKQLPGALEVLITDYAFEHDPFTARAPDLDAPIEQREAGGLGVHFVRTLADEATYQRVQDAGRGANRVRIVKRY